mgnify:FL=1|jgi:hypothetical protein
MGATAHDIAIVPTIIANASDFGNHYIVWKERKKAVEKIMYTFYVFCAIIAVQCAGWADPGKSSPHDGDLKNEKKTQARFLICGGSGPKFGKTAACLLCLYGVRI